VGRGDRCELTICRVAEMFWFSMGEGLRGDEGWIDWGEGVDGNSNPREGSTRVWKRTLQIALFRLHTHYLLRLLAIK
jgi:hypothetical protein